MATRKLTVVAMSEVPVPPSRIGGIDASTFEAIVAAKPDKAVCVECSSKNDAENLRYRMRRQAINRHMRLLSSRTADYSRMYFWIHRDELGKPITKSKGKA